MESFNRAGEPSHLRPTHCTDRRTNRGQNKNKNLKLGSIGLLAWVFKGRTRKGCCGGNWRSGHPQLSAALACKTLQLAVGALLTGHGTAH